jgi:hypothetical protein
METVHACRGLRSVAHETKECALGDVAPIHDRRAELLIAFIDFLRNFVAGADLGDDILADREKGLEEGVIEFQYFYGCPYRKPKTADRDRESADTRSR